MVSFLFSIYIHDLHDFISQTNTEGLNCQLYLKCLKNLQIFLYILYADDTVLGTKSAQQFQNQLLNHFESYCQKWNSNLNIKNLNFLYLVKENLRKNSNLIKYGDKVMDIVTVFDYLRIILSKSGSFQKAEEKQVEKVIKALYD